MESKINAEQELARFKLLTPTKKFRDTASEKECSVLSMRIVYSWLAYRSRLSQGATTRSICKEIGLHPRTVKKAIEALGGLVERRDNTWFAIEPDDALFVGRRIGEQPKHWSDSLAYLMILLPRKGAKVKYSGLELRFGINHSIVFSFIISASKKTGVMQRFTVAGTAKLFDLDNKTVRSILQDLILLRMIERIDYGSYSEIRPLEFTAKIAELLRTNSKPVGKVVSPIEKTPKNSFVMRGDPWDACRKLCSGLIKQELAESIFAVARKLGDGPDDFCSEFERIREIYKNKSDRKSGRFGFYLQACYQNRANEIAEQQRRDKEQQEREAYLLSPEFQRKQAAIEETAKGEPMHSRFVFTDEAITDRVLLASNPVDAWRKLNSYKDRVAMHSKAFVKTLNLGLQEEIYKQGDVKGEIWRHALHKLNGFYRQQTKATAKDLEEAINEACRKVTTTLGPCFLQKDE